MATLPTMWTRFRAAGLVWPTLFALAALAVLLGLGTWQMSRKAWKDGLVAQITASTAAEPSPLGAREISSWLGSDAPHEYRRLKMTGAFVHAAERHVYAPRSQGQGWLVFTPLTVATAAEPVHVIVNRGWVPEHLKDPATRAKGQVSGPVEIVGLARRPEVPGAFTPTNDTARNMWYWRDIRTMASGPPCVAPSRCVTTFYLDAEAEPTNPGGWPRGGATNLVIPNRHLEYALTWYGLAATLVGVFSAFAWGRWRQ